MSLAHEMMMVELLVTKTTAWQAVLASKSYRQHAKRMAAFKAAEAALEAAKKARAA